MFKIAQLSDVPYIGAPTSDWYIRYNQSERTVSLDAMKVTSKVAFDILKDIQRQLKNPPEEGHHYDVTRCGNIIRIGISGHNISISKYDLPNL